jgi:hypothetical protein
VLVVAPGCGGGGDEAGTEAATQPPPAEGDPARGEQVYVDMGCFSCHVFTPAEDAIPSEANSVGPNLDEVAERYDADFIRESIIDPQAYIEKGASGTIGGDEEYGTPMPTFGPDADSESRRLGEQELADLVAFIVQGAGTG